MFGTLYLANPPRIVKGDLAEAGYGLLVLDAWWTGMLVRDDHPNIVMASIAVTGFVVARQVKRLLVLSSYYEQRLPD